MEQESELQRLEKFVEKILTRFSALKAEKEQLDQELFERDLLIEELRENISSKTTERSEISERVNKIVDQIEEWELNLENAGAVTTAPEPSASDADNDQTRMNSQESENRSEEEEKRVQHALFTMDGSKE